MTIDEKIAIILKSNNTVPTDRILDLGELTRNLQCDNIEFEEILKRLEQEGYVSAVDGFGYGRIRLTDQGKKVGRLNTYMEIVSERRAHQQALELQRQIENKRDRGNLIGKRIDRIVTCISVVGTLAISYWSASLNEDMKDVKISMDSIRVEMKALKTSVLESKRMSDTNKLQNLIHKNYVSDSLDRLKLKNNLHKTSK